MRMNWYVIQSKPRQEDRAEANLRARRVETLQPKLLRPSRSPRGAAARIEPMFPGYFFARFDPDAMLSSMRYTRGVAKIVGTPEGPTPLSDGAIETIRDRMDPSGLVTLRSTMQPGDCVRVIGGPFKGLVGVFDGSLTAAQRVSLLLSMLNTQVRVALDLHLVERVNGC